MIKNVPDIDHKKVLSYVFPGPPLDQFIDTPSFPLEAQEITQGAKTVAILKEVIDHVFMSKFYGPFPVHLEFLRLHKVNRETVDLPIKTLPQFAITKQDTSLRDPK